MTVRTFGLVDREFNGQVCEEEDENDENDDAGFAEVVSSFDITRSGVRRGQVNDAHDTEGHSSREGNAIQVAIAS